MLDNNWDDTSRIDKHCTIRASNDRELPNPTEGVESFVKQEKNTWTVSRGDPSVP